MRKMTLPAVVFSIAAGVCLTSTSAQAIDYSIYGQAGLFGLGGGVGIAFNDMFQARLGYGAYSYSFDDVEVEGEEEGDGTLVFDADLDWGAGTALIDFYPFSGAFHITTGLGFSGNGIDLTGKPSGGTYTINGNDYTSDQLGSLKGEADWGGTAPYLGIGWGRSVAKDGHFSFNFDIGVLFTGSPDVSLSASCNADPTLCAQLDADIAQEEKDTEDELADADMIPIINFSVGYRF